MLKNKPTGILYIGKEYRLLFIFVLLLKDNNTFFYLFKYHYKNQINYILIWKNKISMNEYIQIMIKYN